MGLSTDLGLGGLGETESPDDLRMDWKPGDASLLLGSIIVLTHRVFFWLHLYIYNWKTVAGVVLW